MAGILIATLATILEKINYTVAGCSLPAGLVDVLHSNRSEALSNFLGLKHKAGSYLTHLPVQSRADFEIRLDCSVLT